MAHLPTLPDPSERNAGHGPDMPAKTGNSHLSFSELNKILNQHGAGTGSKDLALDLLLHEIVEQACAATGATASAIALAQGEDFVCRATTGEHAPDLGSHLSTSSGLSAACIQSRAVERCDDTERDARVDAAVSRRLGVRSVLVVPLLQENQVTGVLEIFSPRAHTFTDGDANTLSALARKVLDTMSAPSEVKGPVSVPDELFVGADHSAPGRDYVTLALTVLVVALALLLGWLLGHRNWGKNNETETAQTPSSAQPSAPITNDPAPAAPVSGKQATTITPPTTNAKTPTDSAGGLSVYESGRLVFQLKPAPSHGPSKVVEVPASAADSLVIDRVEPQYPEQARLSHIQGPVVLDVVVDQNGTVEELRAVSGDPQLVSAATDAVRQWHFKPYAPRDMALSFRTQVTVDFKLPSR